MKINLIIPKRQRNDRVPICLYYLNQANQADRHDVWVYIIDDAPHQFDFSSFTHLTIRYEIKPFPQHEGFRKTALFNHGFRIARPDFDWSAIVDLDMVYRADYFDLVQQEMEGISYVVGKGMGLDAESTQQIFEKQPPFSQIEQFSAIPFTSDSQASFSRAWYERYREVFQRDDLFDDSFIGWGYEDLMLDFVASQMYLKGLAKKVTIKNTWRHLHHERTINKPQQTQNMGRLYQANEQSAAKLRHYLQRFEDPQIRQWFGQAQQAHQQGQLGPAEQFYRQVLIKNPKHAETLQMLGILCSQSGRHPEAAQYLNQAITIEPHNYIFHNNLGEVWRLQQQFDEAIKAFDKAIYIYPYFPEAHYNMANVLRIQGRLTEAAENYQWAIELRPNYVRAHYNLGNTLVALQQPQQAVAAYQQAIALQPNFTQAHIQLAQVLHQAGQYGPAVHHFQQVIQLEPQNDEAYFRLGNVLQDSGRLDEAAIAYRQALQINPNSPGAHQNLGALLMEQRNYAEAIQHHQRVIALDPNFAGAHYNLGLAYEMQGKVAEAKTAYAQTAKLKPQDWQLQFHLKTLCPLIPANNQEIDTYRAEVEQVLPQFKRSSLQLDPAQLHLAQIMPPYALAYQGRNDYEIKRQWAEVFRGQLPQIMSKSSRVGKPHIGFVVTKGHETIFRRSMEGILNHLSSDQFRLTIVCDVSGRAKIQPAITNPAIEWLAIQPRFQQALQIITTAKFDVIYYWEIGSDTINYFLPFCRPAPVQCLSWGTAVTSGIEEVDYYLSTKLLEIDGAQAHYAEKLIELDALPTYYYRPNIPTSLPNRSHFGLTEDQHIYFCAQNLLKVHPDFDPVIAEILRRDWQGVVLFLGNRDPHLTALLQQRFAQTIPDVTNRIRFMSRLPEPEYLALHALADVSLDTLHYCGANTSYDAFAAGTPVVTLPGEFQRGRYTYATYHKMGVLDCIIDSVETYVDLAVALGTDPIFNNEMSTKITQACDILFEDMTIVEELAAFFEEVIAM